LLGREERIAVDDQPERLDGLAGDLLVLAPHKLLETATWRARRFQRTD
jgi:hypothetical protein